MAYNWNWGVFLQPTATGGDETYLGWMFYGFKMTIALSLSAWLIALAVGAVVGVLRTVPNKCGPYPHLTPSPLKALGGATDSLRGRSARFEAEVSG